MKDSGGPRWAKGRAEGCAKGQPNGGTRDGQRGG